MPYTLKQAAEATSKSKPTILRAIQRGKISAQKDADGEWRIEPAELHRVYPPVAGSGTHTVVDVMGEREGELRALRREMEVRDEKLAAVEGERERERQLMQDTIDDLRRRLDTEAEERRKLVALLTDQRSRKAAQPHRGWLRQLWSRR